MHRRLLLGVVITLSAGACAGNDSTTTDAEVAGDSQLPMDGARATDVLVEDVRMSRDQDLDADCGRKCIQDVQIPNAVDAASASNCDIAGTWRVKLLAETEGAARQPGGVKDVLKIETADGHETIDYFEEVPEVCGCAAAGLQFDRDGCALVATMARGYVLGEGDEAECGYISYELRLEFDGELAHGRLEGFEGSGCAENDQGHEAWSVEAEREP